MNLFESANYPEKEPASPIAGDRWAWKRTDLGIDYDPSLYTLKYSARLEGTGTTEIEITATADGTDFVIEVDAATTGAYTAGTYQWQAYITRDSDSERVSVDNGTMEVVPNRDAATTDPRTHAKIVLDAIEAVIQGRASSDQMSYTIEGRSLTRMSVDELMLLRDKYRAEVAAENRKANGIKSKKLEYKL